MKQWLLRPRRSPAVLLALLIIASSPSVSSDVGQPISAAPRGEIVEDAAPAAFDPGDSAPHSAVLLIGDGMGHSHLEAAELLIARPTLATRFSTRASLATSNARGGVTDSAASATAMATGRKVFNRVISEARPGSGAPLPTVADVFEAAGKSVGIVTTSTLTHATPAAFIAHAPSRYRTRQIVREILAARPTVLIGGGGSGLGLEALREAEYAAFDYLPTKPMLDAAQTPVAVVLGDGHLPFWDDEPSPRARPTLSEITLAAIEILRRNPRGFLLIVEGARIDHASHRNDFDQMLLEATDFVNAVHATLDWREAEQAFETLVVATADHETGGLELHAAGSDGKLLSPTWSTDGHTLQRVPLFAVGPGSQVVEGEMDNTDIFYLLRGE